jgi:two-component system nitrate/nitrite response regulator NarL
LLIADKAFGSDAVIEWVSALRREQPETAIIIWSSSISEVEIIRILQAGVQGVLRKSVSVNDLMNCIRAVTAGETWVDENLLGDTGRPVRAARSPLTLREEQVMDLVERGMKNREIGLQLGIRTGTVKIHLKHIFEKTGIHGRYGLVISGLKEKGFMAAASSFI